MQARGGVISTPAVAARRRALQVAPAARAAADAGGAPWAFRLLLLFVVLLYANLPLHFPELEQVAPAQTVAVAALGVLFFEKWSSKRPLHLGRPEGWLLLGFLAIAGFSTFGALWARYAAEHVMSLAKMIAVYLLVVNTVDSWRRLRIAMGAVVMSGLIPAVGALAGYSRSDYLEGARAGWVGIFENPNDLAYSLVLLLPLALALAPRARLAARPIYLGAALVFTVAILLSYSRGGLLGLLAVSLLCLLSWGSPSVRILGALVVSGSLVFVTAFWTRVDTGGEVVDEETLNLRLTTIKAGAAMLADRPLLGVGLGCSVLGWPLYAPPDTPTENWLHTHNTIVQVFTETGVVGGGVFLTLLGTTLYGVRRAVRRLRQRRRPDLERLVAALGIALVGFLVCGLTGGYVLSWFPYLLLGLASAARALSTPILPVPAPLRRGPATARGAARGPRLAPPPAPAQRPRTT